MRLSDYDFFQMLICVSDEEDSVEDADTKKKDKKNQFPHGSKCSHIKYVVKLHKSG